ncbi:MAG: hypothetical protein IK010_08580 [Bacteroidales bacterium]|nr:hypothetical protein [Bacteroidales bacterium]
MRHNQLFLPLLAIALLCGSCVKEIEDTEYHGDLEIAVTQCSMDSWTQKVTVKAGFGDYQGPEITRKGVCFSQSQEPTINGSTVKECGSGSGNFSTSFDYPGGSVIYVRAFAENTNGVVYSQQYMIETAIDYKNLSLGGFTVFSNYTTVSSDEGFTKHFGVQNIRRILVHQLSEGDDDRPDVKVNLANQDNISNADQFDFCSDLGIYDGTTMKWGGLWNSNYVLFDNNTIGYVAHIYNSRYYSNNSVKVVKSNIGWVLEFKQPVCVTHMKSFARHSYLYYQ